MVEFTWQVKENNRAAMAAGNIVSEWNVFWTFETICLCLNQQDSYMTSVVLLCLFCYPQLGEAGSKQFRLVQPDHDSKVTFAESGPACRFDDHGCMGMNIVKF
ncbi:hypothetical protein V6N11_014222 [Hibiscus sabdariffa]|uniref:Uncharacterized protein n=2 Tax=Hibiscus sabdariffa TaxID=183260 RepID=A0ABR2ANP8_9ROSI